ncbi:hypothetical protein OEZ86_007064 [Tetradesmus obliquus]|nr:hypothetical protein OEZ86_007064 [Tetradesmus obliquus]
MLALVAALLLVTSSRQACTGSGAGGVCLARASPAEVAGKQEEIEGTQVVWALPAAPVPPKGLLLAFHGCGHAATDWFPRSDSCKDCIGLPEEVAIARAALGRGYAVVALSSRDRSFSRCWAVPHHRDAPSADIHSVSAVLAALLPREGLGGLPLYALGASSGGAFVLTLPAYLPLKGVCAQIMGLPADWYAGFLPQQQAQQEEDGADPEVAGGNANANAAAPVLFVHMPRDTHTAALVAEDVELRKGRGLVSATLEVQPQAVTAAFLAGHMPELAAGGAAQQLADLLKQQGLLDAQGLLLHDPRGSDWRRVVTSSSIPGASSWSLAPDKSGLPELLNVAWAGHEIVSDTTAAMLDFFEQQPTQ